MNEEQKKIDLNKGVTVMLLLTAITIGEFLMGLYAYNWWAPLLAVAAMKAFFILRDYMHIGRLFAGNAAEEHS